jgi:UrcA family protein
MKNFALAIAATAMGVTGLATPAMANTTTTKSVKVSYAGLNLNTIEGQKTLDRRVNAAASEVCAYKSGPTSVRQRKEARECYAKARASARKLSAAIIEDEQRGG